jgi:hypothetical protein
MKSLADYANAVKSPHFGQSESFTRVSLRVDDDLVMLLDAMADDVNKSRSNFGGELLEIAIIELGQRLGYELVQKEEGGYEVGRFEMENA